jgi:hypothetical protein
VSDPSWHGLTDAVADLKVMNESVPVVANRLGLKADDNNQPTTTVAEEAHDHDTNLAVEDFIFAKSGDVYVIRGFGECGIFSSIKGFGVIAQLIHTPEKAVPMVELIGADDRTKADSKSQQATLDPKAIREIKKEVTELKVDLAKATKNNDNGEQDRIQMLIDERNEHLLKALGLGKKARDLNNPITGWRSAIFSNLYKAYAKFQRASMPKLARHFKSAISSETGAFVYCPGGTPPLWRFDPPTEKIVQK